MNEKEEIHHPVLKIIKGRNHIRTFRLKKNLFAPELYYSSKYFFRNSYDPLESL